MNSTFFFKGYENVGGYPYTLEDIEFFGGFLDLSLNENKIYDYGFWVNNYEFNLVLSFKYYGPPFDISNYHKDILILVKT